MQARPMGVFNEWGKLREVLVGDSARCVFPRWSPDWGRYHGFKTMLHGLEGVSLQQAMPERAKGMVEQTEAWRAYWRTTAWSFTVPAP